MSTAATSSNPSSPEGQSHPSPHRHQVPGWSAWFSVMAAPLAWVLQLVVNVSLSSYACYPHDVPLATPLWTHMLGIAMTVEAVALLICIAAGLVSWRNWRRSRGEKPGDAHELIGGGNGRSRFVAMTGMLVSGLFLIATAFATINLAGIQPCGG